MSSETTRTNRFYSGSGKYLSPLERKRLRAIENELPQGEKPEPSKRVTRTRTPKRQSSVKEAPKKRKRSASTSSGLTNVRPKKRARVPRAPASEKKALVIPLSDTKRNPPPPLDEGPSSAPSATKAHKFFSAGLRFPTDGSGASAVATTVSWNKKFKLQFTPAVASVKKPAVSIKREMLMTVTVGDVDDEKLHVKHHQSFLAVIKFGGWKNQREVGLYPDGKVVMVSHNDPKVMLKKMEEIQQMVDRELGIVENTSAGRVPHTFFVFVSYTKKVLGFLAAREVKQGYRVIPDASGSVANSYCCESDPVPAVCGVSRIWTAPYYRRKKVASRLLDRLRTNFSFGCLIGLDQIAFSDPTLVGRELAASYTKNDRFLVFGP